MSAPASITKFYDAAERPPIMGWHFFDDPNDRGTYFREASADAVFARVKRLRVNNGKHVSDFDLWRELWSYWCSREPKRCGQDATQYAVAGVPPGPLTPREIDPRVYGPWLWNYLAFEATRFRKEWFTSVCQRFLSLITCPECQSEWRIILMQSPVSEINTAREACEWVLAAHNRVSEKLGKQKWDYARFVSEYGAPE